MHLRRFLYIGCNKNHYLIIKPYALCFAGRYQIDPADSEKIELYRVGKKSVKTLKNYKTRKTKQNKKRFADLASISHGIFFKTRKKNNSKNSRQMALVQTT